MPRPKTTPGKVENPLQKMFGTFLRTERGRLGLSSGDVATQLDISDTYLRLAEAGSATLNQSLIFKIIKVFADPSTPTHDSRTIHFHRLALLMVGLHWIGAEMATLNKKGAARLAMESLGVRVYDFQKFFERTKRYFDLPEGSREQKKFLEEDAALEVSEFLRSDGYGRDDLMAINQGIVQELLAVPTLNVDIILDLKKALADRSFVHTPEVASKWESDRASQFRSVCGLYKKSDLIISEKNLSCFHYEYLKQSWFTELRMIFMDGTASEARLKNDFIKGVDNGRKQARLEPLISKEKEKIHFRCMAGDQQALKILRRHDSAPARDYQAYWSFETLSGLHVGFLGVLDGNPENTRNLNLQESVLKEQQFNDLWRRLNDAR